MGNGNGGQLKVVHSSLDQAVNDMVTTCKQIDERMGRLESDLSPLREGWIGSAKEQYRVSKAAWDQALEDMRELLAQTHIHVSQSNQDYLDADVKGAASFDYR